MTLIAHPPRPLPRPPIAAATRSPTSEACPPYDGVQPPRSIAIGQPQAAPSLAPIVTSRAVTSPSRHQPSRHQPNRHLLIHLDAASTATSQRPHPTRSPTSETCPPYSGVQRPRSRDATPQGCRARTSCRARTLVAAHPDVCVTRTASGRRPHGFLLPLCRDAGVDEPPDLPKQCFCRPSGSLFCRWREVTIGTPS